MRRFTSMNDQDSVVQATNTLAAENSVQYINKDYGSGCMYAPQIHVLTTIIRCHSFGGADKKRKDKIKIALMFCNILGRDKKL